MSEFNQNKIVSIISEVIPSMQKSSDPEGVLLDYAKSKNLPPSVLERVCHAFNQLKTNCILDNAEDMSERGISFSTLDAPEIVEKYTTIEKEASDNNILSEYSKNLYNFSDDSDIQKQASTKNIIGELSELIEPNFELDSYEDTLNSYIEGLQNTPKFEKTASLSEYLDVANLTSQNYDDYINQEELKQEDIIYKFQKDLSKNNDCVKKFASSIKDAKKLYPDSKAITSLVDNVKSHSYFLSNLIDTEISTLDKKASFKLIKESKELDLIKEYIDSFDSVNIARIEKENAINKIAFSIPSPEESTRVSKEDQQKVIDETKKDFLNDLNKEIEKANLEKNHTSNSSPNTKNVNKAKNTKNVNKAKNTNSNEKQQSTVNKNVSKDLDEALSELLDSSAGSLNSILSIPTDTISNLKDISNLSDSIRDSGNKDQRKVLNNFLNTSSDLLFQKMLLTDPVLSKLNKRELLNLIDSYTSYKQQYPELAFQPALLRALLRSSAQIDGGEDINTLKELVSARKNLADAKLKERELI